MFSAGACLQKCTCNASREPEFPIACISEPDLSAFGVDPTTAPVSNAPPPLIEEADGYEMPHKPTKNEKNDCNAVDDANDNSELPTNSVGGSSVLSVVKFPDSEMHEGVAAATALTAADDS